MEIIIKRKKSVLDLNFNGFIQEEKELTDKKIKILDRKNKNYLDDELKKGMVLFRKYVMNEVCGSRKKLLLRSGKLTWDEFIIQTIYDITLDYSIDIDELTGASDIFMNELCKEDTKLTWASYSAYYDNDNKKKKCNPVRKSKRSLEDFFILIDITTGIIMNSNEIDLEIAKLIEKLKVAIKNEKADTVKKMKEDIKKYGITYTDLRTAFKKRKVKVK